MEPRPTLTFPDDAAVHTVEEDISSALILLRLLMKAVAPYRNNLMVQMEVRLDRALTQIGAAE